MLKFIRLLVFLVLFSKTIFCEELVTKQSGTCRCLCCTNCNSVPPVVGSFTVQSCPSSACTTNACISRFSQCASANQLGTRCDQSITPPPPPPTPTPPPPSPPPTPPPRSTTTGIDSPPPPTPSTNNPTDIGTIFIVIGSIAGAICIFAPAISISYCMYVSYKETKLKRRQRQPQNVPMQPMNLPPSVLVVANQGQFVQPQQQNHPILISVAPTQTNNLQNSPPPYSEISSYTPNQEVLSNSQNPGSNQNPSSNSSLASNYSEIPRNNT